jgi:hypothetical protein
LRVQELNFNYSSSPRSIPFRSDCIFEATATQFMDAGILSFFTYPAICEQSSLLSAITESFAYSLCPI